MNIKLDTLSLVQFDKNNKDHVIFLKKIIHDDSIKNRFNGFINRLNSRVNNGILDRAFFVSNNACLIGFIDIGALNNEEKAVYLREAVDKDKRGNNYGNKILNEISNFIFLNYPDVEIIRLRM